MGRFLGFKMLENSFPEVQNAIFEPEMCVFVIWIQTC